MDMGNYPGNSIQKESASPPAEKRVVKAISGNAITKKRTELSRMAEAFISEDVSNLKSYMITKIFIPAVKNAISDTASTVSEVFTSGINTLLFGEAGRNRTPHTNYGAKTMPYGSYWNNGVSSVGYGLQPAEQRAKSAQILQLGYNYDDVCTDSLGAAENVLSQMNELIQRFGLVSVADMYDIAGVKVPAGDSTRNKYGWTNIQSAEIIRESDHGTRYYRIRMPRAAAFD